MPRIGPNPVNCGPPSRAFRARPSRVACLQARLTVDHADESWLTRMFALEYAALFHVIKPGLAALGLPIPLGGTSNHFRVAALRRVNGWDAWNVTEDIDLGFRLARFGYAVECLASTTFEEAPLTFAKWLPQRTRWLKGWMVTLAVHTRQPVRLWRDLGFWGAASVAASLFGTVLSCLFGPLLYGLVLIEACGGTLLAPSTPGDALWSAASCFLVITGAASALWPVVLGLRRCRRTDLLGWTALMPVYLLLVSVAAWCALRELFGAPYAWNKTEHGLAKARRPVSGLA